jgi:unsaturated chondroitin disaccharide hydrolase
MKLKLTFLLVLFCYVATAQQTKFDVNKQLDYCLTQASKTLAGLPADTLFPRSIVTGTTNWRLVKPAEWTSGFWPGILWYAFEYSKAEKWKIAADKYTRFLTPLSQKPALDHDLGFQIFCSFGNGYRITGSADYKKVILRTADTLATLYNPKVGTILSWPFRVKALGGHHTIIDNMMNLEMLMWSSKKGNKPLLAVLSKRHADVTMKNHFRDDYSSYHIVVYDQNGNRIKAITGQGEADGSMWARGQAWAIYGYTMMYKETREKRYLDFAQKVSDVYLQRLPKDMIPYWDFDSPKIPEDTRDASAAAITASALLDLSTFVAGEKGKKYRSSAIAMLAELSTANYQSREKNDAFLMHSRGSKTSEIDVSINYADYYYIEALMRLKKLQK